MGRGILIEVEKLCFCAVLVQISIKISSRRYAEEGLGTTQMCCVGAIKVPWIRVSKVIVRWEVDEKRRLWQNEVKTSFR